MASQTCAEPLFTSSPLCTVLLVQNAVLSQVLTHTLTADDEFLVLACDGIWDCMTNQARLASQHPALVHRDESSCCVRRRWSTSFASDCLRFRCRRSLRSSSISASRRTRARPKVNRREESPGHRPPPSSYEIDACMRTRRYWRRQHDGAHRSLQAAFIATGLSVALRHAFALVPQGAHKSEQAVNLALTYLVVGPACSALQTPHPPGPTA